MAFQDSWMHELLSRNDIVSVVGEYVQLTPRGGRLWACCPFHHEKTASFHVSPDKQLYYCFGCHAGGSVIQFVMSIERLSYLEAIKFLADRVGMDMPMESDDADIRAKRRHRERLEGACREAALFFHSCLLQSREALDYASRRGITPSIIKRFGLGYAPNSWDSAYNHLKNCEGHYTDEELLSAGIIRRGSNSKRISDMFRNRIIFPIISERGSVLGFGARTMGNDNPKYLNTGQTPLFNKRYNLYGLNLLKQRNVGDIIIVEGYMDVIALHSVGIANVVASLGTALTHEQAKLLKRYTQNVYISYDGDSAGQQATLRGMEILANEGLTVRVITLPDNLDPDDYVRKYGSDGFLNLKDEAQMLNAYKISSIARKYDLTDADSRQLFVMQACEEIAKMQPVEQERCYDMVSKLSGFSYDTVKKQAMLYQGDQKNTFSGFRNNKKNKLPFAKNEREKHELLLAACAAINSDAAMYIRDNAMEFISSDAIRIFLEALSRAYDAGIKPNLAQILSAIQDQEQSKTIAAALNEQELSDPLNAARDCTRGLMRLFYEDKLRELSMALDNAEIDSAEYLRQFSAIRSKLNGS